MCANGPLVRTAPLPQKRNPSDGTHLRFKNRGITGYSKYQNNGGWIDLNWVRTENVIHGTSRFQPRAQYYWFGCSDRSVRSAISLAFAGKKRMGDAVLEQFQDRVVWRLEMIDCTIERYEVGKDGDLFVFGLDFRDLIERFS